MYRRVIVGNLAFALQFAAAAFVPLLLVPHIVRSIGLESFGQIAIALAWATYGNVIVDYAFNMTGPRLLAQVGQDSTRESSIFFDIVGAKLLLLACVVPVAFIAISTLARSSGPSVALLCLLLPVAAMLNSAWYLQAIGRFWTVSIISILATAVSLVIVFGIDYFSVPLTRERAALALVAAPALSGVGTFLAALSCVKPPSQFHWSASRARLLEGRSVFLAHLTACLYGLSGVIVVGAIAGQAAAGAYRAVERVANAMTGAFALTHTVAYPTLARLYRERRREYLRLLSLVVAAYVLCFLAMCVATILNWGWVRQFLFGSDSSLYGGLLFWGLAWVAVRIFGIAVVGYFNVSGLQNSILPLTLRVSAISFSLGLPGVMIFGSTGWMVALVIGELLLVFAACRAALDEAVWIRASSGS